MPANYPKFNQKIQDHIDQNLIIQNKNRFGIIVSFDKYTNTAKIILEDVNSELLGSVLNKVPCPAISGIQTTAPRIGTRCVVGFRSSQESNPYVVAYVNDNLGTNFYSKNYSVTTGIPRFMIGS
jgi:hypothetical protein